MNIRLITRLTCAVMISLTYAHGDREPMQVSKRVSASVSDLATDNFSRFPPDILNRISILLEKRFAPCLASSAQTKYETVRYEEGAFNKVGVYRRVIGAEPWEELVNCHMAAFWVASGKIAMETMNSPGLMPELLKPYGFKQVDVIYLFNGREAKRKKVDALKPGDVLQFYRVKLIDSNYAIPDCAHTAVYVGRYKGRQIVFQKSGIGCGEKHPYELRDLEDMIYNYLYVPDFSGVANFVFKPK